MVERARGDCAADVPARVPSDELVVECEAEVCVVVWEPVGVGGAEACRFFGR